VKSIIQLFEDKKIRTLWDEEKQEWYFSIVDVCGALTDQPTQRGATLYWGKMKQRLKMDGNQLLTNCQQLKMRAADGKSYMTDAFDLKNTLRVIQLIPSKKAKSLKMWMAKAASEKIAEKRQAKLAAAEEIKTKQVITSTKKHRKAKIYFLIGTLLGALLVTLIIILF